MGVSNPLRYPRFRTSASVKHQRIACAFGVPSGIYEFNLYSRNSTLLLLTLVYPCMHQRCNPPNPRCYRGISRGYESRPPTCPLRPIITNNACPPRITAAAGTELAGTACWGCVIISPQVKVLQPIEPSSPMRYSWIKLSPIVQDSSLLPPGGVWAVSQSQCG